MKQRKINNIFIFGLIIFSITNIAKHCFEVPVPVCDFFLGLASGLIITGAIKSFFIYRKTNVNVNQK